MGHEHEQQTVKLHKRHNANMTGRYGDTCLRIPGMLLRGGSACIALGGGLHWQLVAEWQLAVTRSYTVLYALVNCQVRDRLYPKVCQALLNPISDSDEALAPSKGFPSLCLAPQKMRETQQGRL